MILSRSLTPALSFALAFGLLSPVATPVAAEDTAAGRLAAFVTNRYLSAFADQRRDVALYEILRACGAQDLATAFLDRVVGAELDLRRDLIAEAESLDAPNLPPVEERRRIVTSLLDAFTATDATNRAVMLGALTDGAAPDAGVCDRIQADVLAQLEAPQPTVLKP